MKCKYCGGNLTFKDLVCPYCRKENEIALKHAQDMIKYHGEFSKTKKDVYDISDKHSRYSVRISIIATLIILSTIFMTIGNSSYNIRRAYLKNKNSIKYEENKQIIETYLDKKEYIKLYNFLDINDIVAYKSKYYDEYNALEIYLRKYVYVHNEIIRYVFNSQDEKKRQIENLIDAIYDFYNVKEMVMEEIDEKYEKHMANIEKQTQKLMKLYLNLTDEDCNKITKITKFEFGIILQDSIND